MISHEPPRLALSGYSAHPIEGVVLSAVITVIFDVIPYPKEYLPEFIAYLIIIADSIQLATVFYPPKPAGDMAMISEWQVIFSGVVISPVRRSERDRASHIFALEEERASQNEFVGNFRSNAFVKLGSRFPTHPEIRACFVCDVAVPARVYEYPSLQPQFLLRTHLPGYDRLYRGRVLLFPRTRRPEILHHRASGRGVQVEF